MILTVCMSPSVDVTIELDSLNIGKVNVVKNKTLSFTGKAINVAIGVARLGSEAYATGFMYNENGETIQQMEFWISDWSYGPACRLPLYVFNGQEKGRELGAWLWEMAQETEANP